RRQHGSLLFGRRRCLLGLGLLLLAFSGTAGEHNENAGSYHSKNDTNHGSFSVAGLLKGLVSYLAQLPSAPLQPPLPFSGRDAFPRRFGGPGPAVFCSPVAVAGVR